MNRGVLGMCILVGSTVGGMLPTLWGQGEFSLASFVCSGLGALVGVWAAVRISAYF
jgi:uncharacterized membrane protein YeaQ/YmgE (transglycosylase-associated protein family)